jgi:prepilin-type N-terminal cleavage/methylation domain-containing protein
METVARSGKHGFTLVEILCVMAIMVLLLTLALANTRGWGRGVGMRSATAGVRACLRLTREWAMTHGSVTEFQYGNAGLPARGYYVVFSHRDGNVGATNFLPSGVIFATNTPLPLAFEPDGSCSGASNAAATLIAMTEPSGGTNALTSTIKVYHASGYASLQP